MDSQLIGIPCYALSNKIGQKIGQKLAKKIGPEQGQGSEKLRGAPGDFFLVLIFFS